MEKGRKGRKQGYRKTKRADEQESASLIIESENTTPTACENRNQAQTELEWSSCAPIRPMGEGAPPGISRPTASLGHGGERGDEVGLDVVEVLVAHRDAHHGGRHARGDLLIRGELG